jgi:2,3-bisphosphoglycerate-independent phosphoglycerate mutase
MNLLFLFLDGVGLGADNPEINPFTRAAMPNLQALLDGGSLIANGHNARTSTELYLNVTSRASLLPMDACLGVDGIPQSATGQAALLTGRNIPALLGYHDGPKPNPAIIEHLNAGTLISDLHSDNRTVSLLNAYPPRYFESIESGYRLPGVFALAAKEAGIQLKTMRDLYQGDALSADLTGQGWRDHLGFADTPTLSPYQAGKRLYELTRDSDLSIFEYWLTDVAGHHQDMQSACSLLETFDTVLGGLLNSWDDDRGLILLTSDHGNLEDLSTRHHTRNDVPLLIVGAPELREIFINQVIDTKASRDKPDLTDISPAIKKFIG